MAAATVAALLQNPANVIALAGRSAAEVQAVIVGLAHVMQEPTPDQRPAAAALALGRVVEANLFRDGAVDEATLAGIVGRIEAQLSDRDEIVRGIASWLVGLMADRGLLRRVLAAHGRALLLGLSSCHTCSAQTRVNAMWAIRALLQQGVEFVPACSQDDMRTILCALQTCLTCAELLGRQDAAFCIKELAAHRILTAGHLPPATVSALATALTTALSDADETVKRNAAQAWEQLIAMDIIVRQHFQSDAALQLLIQRLTAAMSDSVPEVRLHALSALYQLCVKDFVRARTLPDDKVAEMVRLLRHLLAGTQDMNTRCQAAAVITQLVTNAVWYAPPAPVVPAPEALDTVQRLHQCLLAGTPQLRIRAITALGELFQANIVPVDALGVQERLELLAILERMLAEPDGEAAAAAAAFMWQWQGPLSHDIAIAAAVGAPMPALPPPPPPPTHGLAQLLAWNDSPAGGQLLTALHMKTGIPVETLAQVAAIHRGVQEAALGPALPAAVLRALSHIVDQEVLVSQHLCSARDHRVVCLRLAADGRYQLAPELKEEDVLSRVTRGKYGTEYPVFQATAFRAAGTCIGGQFRKQPTKPGSTHSPKHWLGKVGAASSSVDATHRSPASVLRIRLSRDVVREKAAADVYMLLSGQRYVVPKTRLALLAIQNPNTRDHQLLPYVVEELNRGRSPADHVHRVPFVMSKMVKQYKDLEELERCGVPESAELRPFQGWMQEGRLPSYAMLDGRKLSIIGLPSVLAVSRLVADVDVIGGGCRNAGFVVETLNGEHCIRVVKIDPGYALNFADPAIRLTVAGEDGSSVQLRSAVDGGFADPRDTQFGAGSFAHAVVWASMSHGQCREFLEALKAGLMRLADSGFRARVQHREEFSRLGNGVQDPVSLAACDRMWCANLHLQLGIYQGDLVQHKLWTPGTDELNIQAWRGAGSTGA